MNNLLIKKLLLISICSGITLYGFTLNPNDNINHFNKKFETNDKISHFNKKFKTNDNIIIKENKNEKLYYSL